ncbi:MAG: hypothetical protein AMJ65_02205 [Phycisphaerae bacterium SG8_4]|nr:MAG: hypothetical protein AMJ65_02205 [Phycisphaerae bacterium SG8_4]
MRAIKSRLAAVGLICLLLLLTDTATARVRISIGLGTSFGHHYGHYYGPRYPHHRWYGWWTGCHDPWWGHSHWPGHYYPSGSSFWIHQTFPIVINPRPRVKAPADNPAPKPQISQRTRQQLSELLKVLKIGDKASRLGAIRELAPFSFDAKVRAALEEVLLSDSEAELRKQVATSLGGTENSDVTAALKIAKAKDADRGVRQAAYRAIIMIEGY